MPRTVELKIPFTRAFGIEFEFTRMVGQEALREAIHAAGGSPDYIRIADYEHTPSDNPDWVVKRDGSCGWEVCTPRMEGPRSLELVARVLANFKKVGATVGPRCGTHIHFDTSDSNEGTLARYLAYWVKAEGMMFFSLPRKRRANPFCLHLSRAADIKVQSRYSPRELIGLAASDRYRALNVKPHLSGHHRIELRVIEGTLSPQVVWGYCCWMLHFLDRCRKVDVPTDLKWWTLDEVMEWMGWWKPRSKQSEVIEVPDRDQIMLRDWWLRRLIRHAGAREKKLGYSARAKEFLRYFREGHQR